MLVEFSHAVNKVNMLQQALYLVVVAAWATCCFPLLAAAGFNTHPSEVDALVAVKKKLVDPMNHLSNWNKGDPCTSNWTGVLCFDNVSSDGYLHVQELQLLNNNLSGTLAPDIGRLSRLTVLDFMWNVLTGSIPKEIGNIAPLRLLLLNGNRLTGSLPDELGYLTNLDRLQIDLNYISGPIPKSFANLSSVKHLHLNNNSLSGQIPRELSNLSTLVHLLTDNNNHNGYIPQEFASMPMLKILQLDNNNFEGSGIPASYGNFRKLVKLSLRNCSLLGNIPDLSSIGTLHFLDLSRNGLAGSLPSNLSDNMTHIDLSNNRLNGSIPASFSHFPNIQRLSLENNSLIGSVPIDIWKNLFFGANSTLTLDLRNNRLSSTAGVLNPPMNVTLRLGGNPVCSNASVSDISQFCGSDGGNATDESNSSYMTTCHVESCLLDNFYEYVAQPSAPCYCAAPLRIGYRLKSPSFSYFPPYISGFEKYVTDNLEMEEYQLLIDSYSWEAGPRLRMNLKLFPAWANAHSYKFNSTEVKRLRNIFASWNFPGSDLYGPYELLNFTLLGPYSQINLVNPSKSISKGAVVGIVVGAIVCAVVVSAVISLLIARRRDKRLRKLSRKRASSGISMKIEGVKSFSFQEVVLATNNFHSSTEVGKGGYGKVYRGTLADGTVVAIKRAEEGSLQGQKEFLTEIELLSRLHHRNLVSLVGYCDEEDEQMLVYEFMPNGTLQDWIGSKPKGMLDFKARLNIAMESAKGILYLHTEANPPVFHRDIKSSNILLDPKLTAKVADFGLSRLAPVLDDHGNLPDHISTMVKGTPGYLDPEYMLTHKLTDKSDVYSLGIVFLELLTGMRPISHGKNIVREVLLAHKPGILFSIIDSKMGSYPAECVERFVALAIACCQDNPEKRPSMSEVVRELENIVKMMPADSSASGTELSYSGSASYYQGSSGASTSGIHVSGSDLSGSGLLLSTITAR